MKPGRNTPCPLRTPEPTAAAFNPGARLRIHTPTARPNSHLVTQPGPHQTEQVFAKADTLIRVCRGRVRTKTVKRASRVVIEKYYPRLTLDFHVNKKICDEVAIIPSKRLRNKIAGFTTHLMKRIQRGPVRGISFKLQEEERERKDNYVPEVSALDNQGVPIDVDPETKDLLKQLGFDALAVNVVAPQTSFDRPGRRNVVGLGRRAD
ncbi:putative Chrysanthemyl diphosphate synthase [Rhodotorula taiwanensis]|uniref:Putative Chrysanthemyl diphosphate synthase n=1 Tax=Rhodotorula taiwanensis TaxID=741276 RepID=A0A2S5B316_9BASI|nr:putative Chrysanthemyl diphosphate synthase [Rhodotorula taiwanensis]